MTIISSTNWPQSTQIYLQGRFTEEQKQQLCHAETFQHLVTDESIPANVRLRALTFFFANMFYLYPDFPRPGPAFVDSFLQMRKLSIAEFSKKLFLFTLKKVQREGHLQLSTVICENRKQLAGELEVFKQSGIQEKIVFYLNSEYWMGRLHFIPIYLNKLQRQAFISDLEGSNAFLALNPFILPQLSKTFPQMSIFLGDVKRENDHKSCWFMTVFDACFFSKRATQRKDLFSLRQKRSIRFLTTTIKYCGGILYYLGKYFISSREEKPMAKHTISLLFRAIPHHFYMGLFHRNISAVQYLPEMMIPTQSIQTLQQYAQEHKSEEGFSHFQTEIAANQEVDLKGKKRNAYLSRQIAPIFAQVIKELD